jgi:NAD(P)-dependent dehydrogenase (short-subunit alcohol dehydrogenase family)
MNTIADDLIERSADIHWPDGLEPGRADLFAHNAIVALAVELAPIRVNAVAPGIVPSPLWDQVDSSESSQSYFLQGASGNRTTSRRGSCI